MLNDFQDMTQMKMFTKVFLTQQCKEETTSWRPEEHWPRPLVHSSGIQGQLLLQESPKPNTQTNIK